MVARLPSRLRAALSSIRIKLTFFFVAIFGAALIFVSAVGYRFFTEKQLADFDAALFNHAVDLAMIIDRDILVNGEHHYDLPEPPLALPSGMHALPFSLRRSDFIVRALDGRTIAHSRLNPGPDIPLTPELVRAVQRQAIVFSFLPGVESYRMLSALIIQTPRAPMVLQVAAPMTFLELNRVKIRQFLFFTIPFVFFTAAFGGWLLANRAMAPVSLMSETADQIQVGDLSRRLPVPRTRDELHLMALTFNRLLDRIENTVQAHERFVADASHQLKTPLSIIRGELDLILTKPRQADDDQVFLQSASQEINLLIRLVENLLILARVDQGRSSLVLKKVTLNEIALEVISRVSRLVRDKEQSMRIQINPEESQDTLGDPDLLFTLIQNLIENAIKYTPKKGMIAVGIRSAPDNKLQLWVDDSGPGIPEKDLPHVFDRFYRSPGTTKNAKGFGLGLSIGRVIAEAHHGRLEAARAPYGGARFLLTLNKY